ncbi:response regulator [Hymenobacter sp. UYP22]|uniref:response regulator n=1 Tax=Hymenobacter sp. UYP22 TaxID=3156348 RepID=UPI0033917C85
MKNPEIPPASTAAAEPLTVLLVDDDEAARYLGQRLMRPYASQVQLLLATNGQEALQVLHQLQLQPTGKVVVLLDLNMPVMDGFEFLEEYQHWSPEQQRAIRIIVVSSSELPADRQRAQAFGAEFRHKPLTSASITELLQESGTI